MIRNTTTSLFTLFFFLCASCTTPEAPEVSATGSVAPTAQEEEPEKSPVEFETFSEIEDQGPVQEPYQAPPYMCETFRVETSTARDERGRPQTKFRHRRNRYSWKKADRVRTRNLVRTVAREMGADPDFIAKIVLHESTFNPYAIHVLNPDLESNKKAEEDFIYRDNVARDLRWQLTQPKTSDAVKSGIRRRLAKMERYRGNPHLGDRIQFETDKKVDLSANLKNVKKGEKTTVKHTRSVWAYGYGLAGMNATLFLHYWDTEAPPWVLCQDQGIVATAVLVWALRKQKAECLSVAKRDPDKYGEQGTIRTVTHRFARGRCEGTPRLKPSWYKLFEGMDLGSQVRLGRKWKQDSDRDELLAHMRTVLTEKGYYGDEFIPKRPKGAEPKIVAY